MERRQHGKHEQSSNVAIPARPDDELHAMFGSPTLGVEGAIAVTRASEGERAMTVRGTARRTLILFGIAAMVVATVWVLDERGIVVEPLFLVGLVGGLGVALFISASPQRARYAAPVYAALEGLMLGPLALTIEHWYPGIPRNALVLTALVFSIVLSGYLLMPHRVSAKFRFGVVAATGAVALLYTIDILLFLIVGRPLSMLHEAGGLAVGVCLVVVVIASLNLMLDFDYIEWHAADGAPATLEWFGAFSLMVTVVWLFVEILRLMLLLGGADDD